MRQRVSALDWIERLTAAGKASDYIEHFCEVIRPGDRVVLVCRESHAGNESHLKQQVAVLRANCELAGVKIVGIKSAVVLGYCPEITHERVNIDWERFIVRAANLARKKGAFLLATETDRLVRSEYFSNLTPKSAKIQASTMDLERLKDATGGVRLLTLTHPDALPDEVRSEQTKRGQKASGNRGGRPKKMPAGYKLERRKKFRPKVRALHRQGASMRQIAKQLAIPRSTIQSWIND